MEKLTTLLSPAVPLPAENMDTDRIIPARFLKATTRNGMGTNLFSDLRFGINKEPKPDFVLNNPVYSGSILLAGKNFGCGSSREHAVWALKDYGFRVVVSENFADIFRNNALNSGLLPVELSKESMKYLFQVCQDNPSALFEVNVQEQVFKECDTSFKTAFHIPAWKKQCLLMGLDDIDYLLSMKPEILKYENTSLFHHLANEIPW
ncbi:MAG: 3-isopropylmalate dehydratase small subunit [Bacteroidia bacterium]